MILYKSKDMKQMPKVVKEFWNSITTINTVHNNSFSLAHQVKDQFGNRCHMMTADKINILYTYDIISVRSIAHIVVWLPRNVFPVAVLSNAFR